eukprot:4900141-Lingulodinium_polyedra.AAC.1
MNKVAPTTREKESPVVTTNVSNMSTGYLASNEHVVHTVQKCVENCNLDHEKLGARQTPTQ